MPKLRVPETISVREAAAMAGVSVDTIENRIRQGLFITYKPGDYRIDLESFARWFTSTKVDFMRTGGNQ